MKPPKYVINKNSKCPELDLTANGLKLTKEMIENFEVSDSSEDEDVSSSSLEIGDEELMNIQKNFTASFEKSKILPEEKNSIEEVKKIEEPVKKPFSSNFRKSVENEIHTWGSNFFIDGPKKNICPTKPVEKQKNFDRPKYDNFRRGSEKRLSEYPTKKFAKSKNEYIKTVVQPVGEIKNEERVDELVQKVESLTVEPKKGFFQFKPEVYGNEDRIKNTKLKTFKKFLSEELKIKNEMQFFTNEKFNFLKFINEMQNYKKNISRLHNKIRLFGIKTVQNKISAEIFNNAKPVDVKINLIEGIFVQTKEIKAKQDIDSIFRSELNKVTWDNIHIITENILKLQVPNQEMMTRLASILYEKCISEELYIRVYAQILSRMQFVFTYKDEFEIKNNENQPKRTYFFRKITAHCIDSIKNLRSWICDTRGLNEKESEELITEKYRIRTKVLLSIELLCLLYMESSISQKGINKVAGLIGKLNSEEDVESACYFLEKIGRYAIENKDDEIITSVQKLISRLNEFQTENMRIEILINQTMENLKGEENKSKKTFEKNSTDIDIPERLFKKYIKVEDLNDAVDILLGDFEEMTFWEDEDYAEGYAEKLNRFGEDVLCIATFILIIKGNFKKSIYEKYISNFKNIKKDIFTLFEKYLLLIKIDYPRSSEKFKEMKKLLN